jgi:hypothetical protein
VIILSVGMPRAGSGWYYNLTNDLMLASGAQDARLLRQRYHLQKILTEVNCNIGALTPRRLIAVMLPSLMGNTFVIKAHAAPSPLALRLIRMGHVRPTFIYRDPRDALLSIFENGQRAIQRGQANAFSQFADFDSAFKFMLDYMRVWEAWMACQDALQARYEDLLTHYQGEAERLVEFLGLERENQGLVAVIDQYRPEKSQLDQKGLHFRHGKIGRFRTKLSPEQQETLTQAFDPYLERMGYAS